MHKPIEQLSYCLFSLAVLWYKFMKACEGNGNPKYIIMEVYTVAKDSKPTLSHATVVSLSPKKTSMEEQVMYLCWYVYLDLPLCSHNQPRYTWACTVVNKS